MNHVNEALALLAPIVVNILAFHGFLVPSGLAIALVVLALEIFLAWTYRDVYRPMLAARVRPGDAAREPSKRSRSVGDHITA